MFIRFCTIFVSGLCLALFSPLKANAEFITVASTTSTQNSGLFGSILPKFTAASGIEVRVVAVGTGQAIRLAKNGDADVLFVHHRASEEKFVAEGYGVKRYDVMFNDFVIIGPHNDPAGIRGLKDTTLAFTRIQSTQSVFVSRGDDSGTHKKEVDLWRAASIDLKTSNGSWHRELGSGMGGTLNTAAAMGAYSISDRGTWISFKNRQGLELLSFGDPRLYNPYGVILVNAVKHPHVKSVAGQAFIDWLVSHAGQNAITDYKRDGQQLFFTR